MSKLPALQFYVGDWRKDAGVQALSFHDRGVWFEILCLMHESEERGKLLLNGQAMPDDALARLLGLDKQVLTKTLTTLLTFGVASRDPETGALMNRRMVRDEEIRKIRQQCGKMGGNPLLLNHTSNQKPTTQDNQKPTPSVSSSISASTNKGFAGTREEDGDLPGWDKAPPEIKIAWQRWEAHVAELNQSPTRMGRRAMWQDCQRHTTAEIITELNLAMKNRRWTLRWDATRPMERNRSGTFRPQTEAERDKQRTGLDTNIEIPEL
jgi:hypothetical protein